MNIGMMWLMATDDKRMTSEMEINNAVQHYKNKYGTTPDTCHINPIHMNETPEIKGLSVVLDADIMPKHLWIGSLDEKS